MDDNMISSPPYPGGTTKSKTLYVMLGQLRNWLIEQQDEIRDQIPPRHRRSLVAPDNLAPEAIWENVAVLDKYTVFTYLRRIRESWDHILREHEDSWDSRLALQRRFTLVLMAQHILSEAFVDPERREAREAKAMQQFQKQQRILNEHLRKVLIPLELQNNQAEEDDQPGDDQDWWSPEDGE